MSSPNADNAPAQTADTGGSNLSRVRAHNERLVLSVLRDGARSRAEIARLTGLSAQTITLIVRALVADGLVRAGRPVRGRVGQPSVPLTLAPRGAWFAGMKIGRRSVELVLIDFTGALVKRIEEPWGWPDPARLLAFVARELPKLLHRLPRSRVHGLGVAIPSDLWQWPAPPGAPTDAMTRWREHDPANALASVTDLPVFVENDANAACGAELTFGHGRHLADFAYFFVGYYVGGGLVLDSRLHAGKHGRAAAFGSLPVRATGRPGELVQLLDEASVHVLESMIETSMTSGRRGMSGAERAVIWHEESVEWTRHADIVERWSTRVGVALAQALVAVASVVEIEAVVIDGTFPPALRERLRAHVESALADFDTTGIVLPSVLAGSIGGGARALGAARLPLFSKFLLDRDVLTRIAS